jgi:hypothetical protein
MAMVEWATLQIHQKCLTLMEALFRLEQNKQTISEEDVEITITIK